MTTSAAPSPSDQSPTGTEVAAPTTTVLVTGANKGLGAETSRRLAALGWTVWMAARDVGAATDAAASIRDDQPDADLRTVPLDVTDESSVIAAYDVVASAGTGLDVLINNAGARAPSPTPSPLSPPTSKRFTTSTSSGPCA